MQPNKTPFTLWQILRAIIHRIFHKPEPNIVIGSVIGSPHWREADGDGMFILNDKQVREMIEWQNNCPNPGGECAICGECKRKA